VVEMKASESDVGSKFELDPNKGKQTIDAKPNATISITNVEQSDPEDSKEGECLFHSQMWVKGALFHFITDGRRQKNLIL